MCKANKAKTAPAKKTPAKKSGPVASSSQPRAARRSRYSPPAQQQVYYTPPAQQQAMLPQHQTQSTFYTPPRIDLVNMTEDQLRDHIHELGVKLEKKRLRELDYLQWKARKNQHTSTVSLFEDDQELETDILRLFDFFLNADLKQP